MCKTNDGGVAVRIPVAVPLGRKTIWSRMAEVYGDIVVMPDLQEAYNLVSKLQPGTLYTKEGVNVVVPHVYPAADSRSRRRPENTMLRNAVAAVQSEVTGKLQYLSNSTLDPMSKTVSAICKDLGVHESMLKVKAHQSPDALIRWTLDHPYLTASIMDETIIYWPCKPVNRWYTRPNMTESYTELPIQFHNDQEWVDGYMNTNRRHLTHFASRQLHFISALVQPRNQISDQRRRRCVRKEQRIPPNITTVDRTRAFPWRMSCRTCWVHIHPCTFDSWWAWVTTTT